MARAVRDKRVMDSRTAQHRRGSVSHPAGLARLACFHYTARLTRRPGSRWQWGNLLLEESPGSMETRRRIMSARREPRESATESRPPAACGW